MQSTRGRMVVLALAIAAAVALFFVLREGGDGGGEATTPRAEQPGEAGAGRNAAAGEEERGERRPRPSRPAVPTVEIVDGEPKGGPLELIVESGEEVRFRVDSDTPGEVHVHGYEIFKEVEAGETAGIGFPAEIEGVFEIEMHRFTDEGHVEIASLEVKPS